MFSFSHVSVIKAKLAWFNLRIASNSSTFGRSDLTFERKNDSGYLWAFGQPSLQFLWFNIGIFIKFFVVTNLSFVYAGVLFKRLCKLICRLVVQTGILFVLGIWSATGSVYEMLCRSYCSMDAWGASNDWPDFLVWWVVIAVKGRETPSMVGGKGGDWGVVWFDKHSVELGIKKDDSVGFDLNLDVENHNCAGFVQGLGEESRNFRLWDTNPFVTGKDKERYFWLVGWHDVPVL
jgi:hypothetical protein